MTLSHAARVYEKTRPTTKTTFNRIRIALDRSDGSPLYKSIKSSPYRGRRSVKRSEAHLKKIYVCCQASASQGAPKCSLSPTIHISGCLEVQILRAGPSLTLPQDDLSSIHILFVYHHDNHLQGSHHGMLKKSQGL